jgi:hypothetical protein
MPIISGGSGSGSGGGALLYRFVVGTAQASIDTNVDGANAGAILSTGTTMLIYGR